MIEFLNINDQEKCLQTSKDQKYFLQVSGHPGFFIYIHLYTLISIFPK